MRKTFILTATAVSLFGTPVAQATFMEMVDVIDNNINALQRKIDRVLNYDVVEEVDIRLDRMTRATSPCPLIQKVQSYWDSLEDVAREVQNELKRILR